MPKIVDIELEVPTAEAFQPFGQLISAQPGPPAFTGAHIESWRLDFAADGGVELMFARYAHQPLRFHLMERHFAVTQSFVALGGEASVMAVATPTDLADRAAVPRPESVRAFYVDGSAGVMLWRGTWHTLTRFPVSATGAAFALITGAATQRELERQTRDGTPPKLTQVVDFDNELGIGFQVVDARGLIAQFS